MTLEEMNARVREKLDEIRRYQRWVSFFLSPWAKADGISFFLN
ncbi:MAG TPA: hypothetical protein PK632_10975 [Tenuifilaceae bacterium]|nr:hypothetical protein [Tenuifilaceae bacterium]HPX08310.1 hypothetical protein [Tenuifilaceae bacterium]HQC67256.1 hypothetical protein [Tenuifilaceae bacterium]